MLSFEIKDALILDEQCDFIYNNFHLTNPLRSQTYVLITWNQHSYTVPVCFEDTTAHLGIWLYEFPSEVLSQLCKYLFKKYPKVDRILYRNSPQCLAEQENCVNRAQNHWKILLPSDPAELKLRLSAKKRYNIKREKRIVQEQLGEYEILEFTADTVPAQVVDTYFEYKRNQFGTDYHTNAAGYLDRYHVSHVYVLQLQQSIGAIVMSCEQGAYVYLENLAYNPDYRKYSLGAILYDIFLEILVAKGKKGIYLGYGHHQYKSMYGAIEQTVYTGTVYRSRLLYTQEILFPRYYKKLRSMTSQLIRSVDVLNFRAKFRSHTTNSNKE